jgi:pimeloyl-ACP methyl ester carboxylesterase
MPLTSVRLLVLLCVVAVALVVLAVRSRWWLRAPAGLLALVVLLAGVATGVNRHFDLYRNWGDLLGPHSRDLVRAGNPRELARATAPLAPGAARGRGTLLSLTIPATTSHLAVDGGFVYLPASYRLASAASTVFPVVEAFGGSPGRPVDWLNGVLAEQQLDHAIAQHRMAPAIVVFPPTNLSILRSLECTNTADGLRDEDYLTRDVRDWVTRVLRTDHQPWTAIGYSTGGYCALDLAVRHPDLFNRAISLDGYGQALQDRYARHLWTGPADRLAHSPNWWVLHHRPEPVSFYLVAGARDREARRDATRTWSALGRSGWLQPADVLMLRQHEGHTFDAWQRDFLPSLVWALPPRAA